MTFREYLQKLQFLAKENPETLDLEVVYSQDDEGNNFYPVIFGPTVGYYNKEENEFIGESEYIEFKILHEETNAICIN